MGTASPILLDSQQSLAVRLVLARTDVALVGPAGCGKSVVLRALVDAGRRRFGHDGVLVLAWAGSDAQLVGGVTVSSVLRTMVGDRSKETILWRLLGNPTARNELLAVRMVEIDQAPTIKGRWMDRLEFVLRKVAPSPALEVLPFGGRRVLGTSCLLPSCLVALCWCLFARARHWRLTLITPVAFAYSVIRSLGWFCSRWGPVSAPGFRGNRRFGGGVCLPDAVVVQYLCLPLWNGGAAVVHAPPEPRRPALPHPDAAARRRAHGR